MTQDQFDRDARMVAWLRGESVDIKKIRTGGDRVVQRRDMHGRPIGKPQTYEIKTGNSQLSDAQKRRKQQSGKDYHVRRYR